jgi:hypothetical protein
VTTALKAVVESGTAVRRPDGSWLLKGSPPDELSRMSWHNAHAPAVPVRRRAGSAAA